MMDEGGRCSCNKACLGGRECGEAEPLTTCEEQMQQLEGVGVCGCKDGESGHSGVCVLMGMGQEGRTQAGLQGPAAVQSLFLLFCFFHSPLQ